MAGENTFIVRRMRPDEVSEAYKLIEQEDFGLRREKHALLYETFPEAFFVIVSETDEIAGTVSFAETIPKTFELGYMVVKKSFRKGGLGRKLVEDAMIALAPQAVAAVIGPGLGTKQFYTKLGFQPSPTLQPHIIYIMIVNRQKTENTEPEIGGGSAIMLTRLVESEPIDDLVAYDALSRTYDNRRFVSFMARYYKVLVARDAQTQKIVGFAAANVHDKQKILVLEGLYADSDAIARQLFMGILAEFPELSMMKLQSFKPRTYLTTLGVGEVCREIECDRFTIGEVPAVPEDRVYCVTDSEFTM